MTVYKYKLNPYFFIPFLLWCIGGAYLLCRYDSTTLFAFVNGHHTEWADYVMEAQSKMGEAWLLILIGLAMLFMKPLRNIRFVAAAILCTVLPSLVAQLLKHQIGAPRPMLVYEHQPWVHHLERWASLYHNSFPSGHTTGAFSFFCLLATVMPHKYRNWGFVFFLLALATAYSRLYLAAHFFADVYVGSLIGTLLSFIICQIVYSFKNKREQAN